MSDKIELTQYEKSMLEAARACGGIEVHRDDWPEMERLVKAGLATNSHGRGPGGDFKRMWHVDDEEMV